MPSRFDINLLSDSKILPNSQYITNRCVSKNKVNYITAMRK
jgi:hypothetical protein